MNDMGRKAKMRLDYFPMDVDFFQDLKIRKLIKRQGGKAIAVYTLLLCYIYKNGYYMKWDSDLPFICSEQTGFDEAYVREVIGVCLSLGLFSKALYDKEGILTSRGIQERYGRICQLTRRTSVVSEYSLIEEEADEEIQEEKTSNAVSEPAQEKPARKRTRKTNKKEDTTPPPAQGEDGKEDSADTLDRYIDELDKDTVWLDEIQFLHGMNKDRLRAELRNFRSECIANGKTHHTDISDVKHHFNSWLRIVNEKKTSKNETVQRNNRRGNILAPQEKQAKNYGGTF